MTQRNRLIQALTFCALLLLATPQAIPYSVQSHEALIDLAWKQSIRPLLLKRYPNLTDAQIQEAHAYAYGGCAIQDFGYYPFGKRFFSDLTHYVRAGDFVLALMRDAKTPDELAFAIGALSHYIGDITGHSLAINRAVPVEFPKLRKKYGDSINFAENPHAHVQTEFAFDINQLTKRRFAPSGYLNYVGLGFSNRLLRQAFFEVYGLNLSDVVGSRDNAVRTYRSAVRRFIPNIARAETLLHKKSFPPDVPSPDLNDLAKDLIQASADNDWERFRKSPGFTSHLYAGFIFILPKVGSLKMLAIRGPNQQTEDLYIKSFNRSIHTIRFALEHIDTLNVYMANRDLDTGDVIRPGGYLLCDKTYARLLSELTKHPEHPIPAQLKHDISDYYADPHAPISTKNDPQQWETVQANLKILDSMKAVGELNLTQIEPFGDE
jgi:hypothetical protein